MADLADIIRSIPLFSGLSREDVAKILGKLEENSFTSGTTVFSQGDKGDAFYLIHSGAVQVVLESPGRSEIIAVLGPQNWFGEMALLSGEPRSATIVAVKDTTVWRLSRDAWDELIEKHPSWLLHFCAMLSKRLSNVEQQYSRGRDAFNSLAEEFYSSRPPEQQQFFRHASLLTTIDPGTVEALLKTEKAQEFLVELEQSQFPLIRALETGGYELHGFFKDFLAEKLLGLEGQEAKRRLHARLAGTYEELRNWPQAIHHRLEAQDWPSATRLLVAHKEELLNGSAPLLKNALEKFPPDQIFSDLRLVHIKADALAHLGDYGAAVRTYKEVLSQRASGALETENLGRYQNMAEILLQKEEYSQALNCLRNAVNLLEQNATTLGGDITEIHWDREKSHQPSTMPDLVPVRSSLRETLLSLVAPLYQSASLGRWIGGILGLAVWAYLWFWPPKMELEPAAIKQIAILSLALIYWGFWVLPEHGVALLFALALILTQLRAPEEVVGGFASTTWFMSLGVLGLGAAITGSGLFYRLSLQLVRFFPLTYYWQTVALGIMGVVVAAIIPQKSARTSIISQMIVNLSESLGYKTPSRASTGLFASAFLGLGQLNFVYLTGSTATLLAWGLLPSDVRAQFTWGYWFLATIIPTLVVIAVVIASINFLFQPESQAQISYKMVRGQLQILGPLSREEWITLGVLFFTVIGWLTFSYHGVNGAWISLIGLCVLINTGVLGWGSFKKGIDWEFLIYLGITQNIPSLLTKAKIDAWLGEFFSPLVLPFAGNLPLLFIIVALLATALKLVFTQRLTVITLVVALVPLSADMGISPWVMTMIILVGSEPWFFRFQIDWHTLAYTITEGKGFTYPLMCRVNPFFVLAYLLALMAAIPYWRYLGLMG